jgi:hypothetical protein
VNDVLRISYEHSETDRPCLLVFKDIGETTYVIGEFYDDKADSLYHQLTEQGNPFIEKER